MSILMNKSNTPNRVRVNSSWDIESWENILSNQKLCKQRVYQMSFEKTKRKQLEMHINSDGIKVNK